MFQYDLENETLPQWMFITPNMTNDGHDTSVTVAGKFCMEFLTPLLENEYFMERTLILITFDENETYQKANRVFSILLGGAVSPELVGTTDDNYYVSMASHIVTTDYPHTTAEPLLGDQHRRGQLGFTYSWPLGCRCQRI